MAEQPENTHVEAETTTPETTEEKTVGEIISETTPEEPKKPEPKVVGLDKFLDLKKTSKEREQVLLDQIAELEKAATRGASDEDIAKEIEAIAEEFGVEPKFASKLAKTLEAHFEKKTEAKLKPFQDAEQEIQNSKKLQTEKEKQDAIQKAFDQHFTAALDKMPEYKEIADAETIKALSLLAKNANKTFPQLIEETYGKAIVGKRTIETTTPAGGKEPEAIDYSRAKSDTKYFEQIMADPKLKKEYNEHMVKGSHRRH